MTSATAIPIAPGSASGIGAVAALCKAAGDPLRLDILRVLSRDSFGVLELCRILDCSQPGMSHHLKILAKAGLLITRREGNSIYYRRAWPAAGSGVEPLHRGLLETVDQLPLAAAAGERLQTVQAERAESSRRFFAENAEGFREQQELIAAFGLYGPQAAELVASCFPQPAGLALEVGPGEGAFLAQLAPRFQRVIALDNSREMLEQARRFSRQQGFENVEFLLGDTRESSLAGLGADCVVLNMVLHHVSSPAAIFQDLALALKPGGTLIVTDLCGHDQPWVRQACGDLWLGFEPEDLAQWARAAGLSAGRDVYLAQRNGFRVQIRQFINARSA